ncbi:MAG TPA: GNAT family N-acetyltransferase [Blastocatellia bacterium]|nr:GNAT family N-acetyltransferase [Blastocatellia bacterium]
MRERNGSRLMRKNTSDMNPAVATLEETSLDSPRLKPANKPAATPGRGMRVLVLKDFSSLEQYVPAWEELAASAIEPNPFYESWMLIPALRTLGVGKDLRLVLIFAPDKSRPAAPPILCGVFPLERKPRYKGLPVSVLSLWKHLFCFLCAPLVRADCARQCLAAFLDWVAGDPSSGPLVEFNYVSGEGPFHQALADCLRERLSLSFVSDLYNRALLRPRTNADDYQRAAMSREHRKDLRRRTKRLADLGRVEHTSLESDGDVNGWVEDFMRLESRGWKGKLGGALASSEANRAYFMEVAKEAHRRGRLMMLALELDGKPIAQKCNFLAGNGSFAFKIAYDEDYARYSPGFLLEVANIARLHATPEIEWMDSCAVPDHPMINRLWLDRRTIQTVLIPTGKRGGELIVSLMPLIRWINRKLRGIKGTPRQTGED